MLSFFKINTFYKQIILFILFVVLRFPAFWGGIPWQVPELKAVLVAARMHRGYFLYTEIWDDIAPLSALFFGLIYELFGNSPLIFHLIASALIFAQAMLLNHFLQKRRVFDDFTLIPALLYLLFMSCFPDFYILTPALLANTFLILVIRYLYLHIGERRRYNAVFEIGAYLGIATLFYVPSIMLLGVPLLAFLLYTGTKFKDYLLMYFAYVFTVGICVLVFYILEAEYAFYRSVIHSVIYLKPRFLVPFPDLLLLFAVPLLVLLISRLNVYQYRRYSNYQNRGINIIMIWWGVALFSVILASEIAPHSFMATIPATCILLSHYFLTMRRLVVGEAVFGLLLLTTLYFNYSSFYNQYIAIPRRVDLSSFRDIRVGKERLVVEPGFETRIARGKKVLVCGDNLSPYLEAEVATPYLNWRLAQRHFTLIDRYYNIRTLLYRNLFENERGDVPEIILDFDSTAYEVFDRIPLGGAYYEKLPEQNIFIRKTNSKARSPLAP